jgi:hypothetical protein
LKIKATLPVIISSLLILLTNSCKQEKNIRGIKGTIDPYNCRADVVSISGANGNSGQRIRNVQAENSPPVQLRKCKQISLIDIRTDQERDSRYLFEFDRCSDIKTDLD